MSDLQREDSPTHEAKREGNARYREKVGLKSYYRNVYGPDHEILAVVEANNIESVREFIMQSRLVQWNTTAIHATWSMEEALEKIDTLPAIF